MRAKAHLIYLLSAVLLGGGAGQVSFASQLEGVCRTDAQTLANIRADADQTLWNFMLSVCGVNLSASAPQALSVSASNFPEVLNTSDPRSGLVKQDSQLPRHSSSLEDLAPQEHALASSDRVGGNPIEKFSSASKVEESTLVSGSHASADAETSAAPTKRERSIYELLETVSAHQINEVLPAPLDYKPSRFSRYRPDPHSDWSASNQGSAYLKKPPVMETVPYGFYVGTSVGSSLPVDGTSRSELPSVIVGYSDERAIRDFSDFYGVGFRLEGEVVRSRSKDAGWVSTRDNVYTVTGEIYQPLGGGFFWGVGVGYGAVRNVLVQQIGQQAVGEFDGSGYDIYVPMGLGFVTPGGRSGKLQLDFLLASRTKAKWTPLSGTTVSDLTIKRGFGRGIGFEVNYLPFPKFEPFLRYEWADKSKPYNYTLNGAVVSDRAEVSRGIEMGLRYYW